MSQSRQRGIFSVADDSLFLIHHLRRLLIASNSAQTTQLLDPLPYQAQSVLHGSFLNGHISIILSAPSQEPPWLRRF
mgnify:CR=1 FL=1